MPGHDEWDAVILRCEGAAQASKDETKIREHRNAPSFEARNARTSG